VKRLIVLLIVLAGGLAAAAFTVPSNAASVNGVSIGRQQLNSDLNAIAGSTDYRCFLNAEEAVATGGETSIPSVDGSAQIGDGTSRQSVSTGFAAYNLETAVGHQLVLELAAQRHIQVTPQDLAAARAEYEGQITTILSDVAESKYTCGTTTTAADILGSMPASFIDRTVRFDATVSVLEEDVAGVGSTTADLQRYYGNHAAEFDTACLTVAGYSTEAEAQAGAAAVAFGTPFSTVAAQTQGGGPQKCEILYGIASSLPAGSDLATLPLNTVSSPISTNSSYFLVEITKRTPTPFAKARAEVEGAVEAAGASKASTMIDAAEKAAHVSVDARYGAWAATRVVPPTSPPASELLNRSVDGTVTKAAASTGQSS
jgi:PPIC-type PPIASE domain